MPLERLAFGVILLAGCQATTATAPPTAPAPALTTRAPEGPQSTAPAPPPPPPGERPSVACKAKHPVAELPLSSVNIDDWANALAGYKPQANSGRPVAWEGAEAELRAYLEAVHACVHVAFFESFLASLDALPKNHPLADPELATTLEIVIDGESGSLADIGIVASSGVPELDAAAVAAFHHAFPLEPPPPSTLSSDGRLYVTWELHRSREQACSAASARAWKLRF
jgi:outer membrane biosynthesis protein TonB